jgi:hypothetical protein
MMQLFKVLAHIAQTVNNVSSFHLTLSASSHNISCAQNDARGGRVLSLLHQITLCMAGDKKSQEICFNLTQKASKPYLKSLDEWLMNGVINDPFDEVSEL